MYDCIVIGGGHAGIEAALATSRRNFKTLLITGNIKMIGSMPCNPSVGGPAKGVVVREIDALGGEMAKNADKTAIQFRMLNSSKGPAVRALRAQSDKIEYANEMQKTLFNTENLEIIEKYVTRILTNDKVVTGVETEDHITYDAKAVILTTGTYMASKILQGFKTKNEGPDGQRTTNLLSESLRELGFELLRLKTGTPPRVLRDSIDFSHAEINPGDNEFLTFSYETKEVISPDKQVPCYLIHTTDETRNLILDNLGKSSMYGGIVEGVGPRYCPSIEDKVVRFKDKLTHQIFLEPESLSLDTIYVQGFSTSMPVEIQEKMVHSLPGFENAIIKKPAYAIEYDAINPTELKPSLETKRVENLFLAGQVNGTSGYEEAACQGLMAGINAGLKILGKEPLILRRDEAYIGVLIDDLVTKGVKDPYRLLTSRAEHRLLLRYDNADIRLTEYGHKVGLISDERYLRYSKKIEDIKKAKNILATTYINPTKEMNQKLTSLNIGEIKDKLSLAELLKRPECKINDLKELNNELIFSDEVLEQVEIDVKYEGYIVKALKQAEDMNRYENVKIPDSIDYDNIHNMAKEAREKLKKIKPLTIGQALRVSGVNPADIQILHVYLKTIE